MVLLYGAALFALGIALTQLLLAVRIARRVPDLATIEPGTLAEWPRLSIVVPARDEEARIEGALRSKLANGYSNLEVIVVDDRSTDRTSALVAAIAAKDSRVVVARVDELPPGWMGKQHAMAVGAARATGDWLLFSDADVHIEPGALQRVVAHAERNAIDFVALMPRLHAVSPLLDATVVGVIRAVSIFGRVWMGNDDASAIGIGIGAFNLVRRRALANSPGIEFLKMEMADDIALGGMLKASGARCRFYAARDAVHLVFAERLDVIARGMEKGGSVFGFSLVKTALMTIPWLTIEIGIPFAAIVAGGTLALIGSAQLAAMTAMQVVHARHFRFPLRGALLWLPGLLLSVGMGARSGILAWWRGAIVWRGTRYGKAEVRAGRRWVNGHVDLGFLARRAAMRPSALVQPASKASPG
jgi:cellulose synthase/poly-beta-1,6-N-acetylglucosamine synthase-like glycosyltransferase